MEMVLNPNGLGMNQRTREQQSKVLDIMINEKPDNDLGFTATEFSRKYSFDKQSLIQNLDAWVRDWVLSRERIEPKKRTEGKQKQEPRKYYKVTNIGSYQHTRQNILNKEITEDELRTMLENFSGHYEHISRHWNKELVNFDDLRVKCLYHTISLINYEIWDNAVLGFRPLFLRMRMIHNLSRFNFTFEKNYVKFSKTELEADENQDVIRQVVKDDPFEYDDSQAQILDNEMERQIENDLPKFITYLFYYMLFVELDYLNMQIKKFKEKKHNKKLSKAFQLRGIQSLAKQFEITTNIDFGKDINKFEKKITTETSKLYEILRKTIQNDHELNSMMKEVHKIIHDESKKIPSGIKEIVN